MFAWLVAMVLLLALAGIARAQVAGATMPATTQATQAANEQLKPAADAAWAVLQALRDYVHAAQILDNPQQRAESLAKARKNLMDLATLRPGGDPETLETYVLMWPVVVAHYVDGFQRDKMTLMQADQHVLVMAVAAKPDDQQKYDELFQQITKDLQSQGFNGDSLASLRQVRLTRDLAQKGIGLPVTAVVQLVMQNVNGQWKASELDLRPPRGQPAASQPVRVVPRTILKPATQPAR